MGGWGRGADKRSARILVPDVMFLCTAHVRVKGQERTSELRVKRHK